MADQQNSSNDFALAMSFKVEGRNMLVLSLRVIAALATFGALLLKAAALLKGAAF